ncbi:MAG: PhnD/SsuA/transferrin family substrate-binding protein [Pseudomonadota bacterium]
MSVVIKLISRGAQRLSWTLCLLVAGTVSSSVLANDAITRLYLPVTSGKFTPVINSLQQELEKQNLQNIRIETIDYWYGFQQGLRTGQKGIYFAPPHFVAWSVSRHSFIPLVRLNEPISYVIVVARNNFHLFELNDLAEQKICASRPLNLEYLVVNQALSNTLLAPDIEIVDSVADQMLDESSPCQAFSITDHTYRKLAVQFPDQFIRLYQSDRFNNYAVVAHPEVPNARVEAVQVFLLQKRTQEILAPISKLFSDGAKLVPSVVNDYPDDYWQSLEQYWAN